MTRSAVNGATSESRRIASSTVSGRISEVMRRIIARTSWSPEAVDNRDVDILEDLG